MLAKPTAGNGRYQKFERPPRRIRGAIACTLLFLAIGSYAQDYPSKPVRLVAPFSAGGGADSVARLIAEKLAEAFGTQFFVDNRPGASNIIGTELVAKAAPDGHTILLVINNHAINASLFPKLPYDTDRDFVPITLIGLNPFILVVHPSLPARSVQELIDLARARPGVLNYASAGTGTAAHVAAELFNLRAKVKMMHIPYKGVSQAVIDLVAGNVHLMFPSPGSALAQVQAGRLRLLAVTTRERVRSLPNVPTIGESGLPGYEFSNWWGLLAPRGTPDSIVQRLSQEVAKALQQPNVQARLGHASGEPVASTPAYFRDFLKSEISKYALLVKQVDLKSN